MEIELNSVIFAGNVRRRVNYNFSKGRITGILKDNDLIASIRYNLKLDDIAFSLDNNMYELDKCGRDVGYISLGNIRFLKRNIIYDELLLKAKAFKYKVNSIEKRISDVLRMVGLDDSYCYREIDTLSDGELVKFLIADCLILNPKIIVMDGIDVYLDNYSLKKLFGLVSNLKKRYQKTIIIISSDVDNVYDFADEYVIIGNAFFKTGVVSNVVKFNSDLITCGFGLTSVNEFVNLVKEKKNILLGDARDLDDLVRRVIDNV